MEVGENLGAALADGVAADVADEQASKHVHVIVLQETTQESYGKSSQLLQRVHESVVRTANALATGSPAVLAISAVSLLAIMACISASLVSLAVRPTHHSEDAKPLKAEARTNSHAKTGSTPMPRIASEARASRSGLQSMSPRTPMPTETFQSRRMPRIGGGSQNNSPKVVEPPPFYAIPSNQDSGIPLQTSAAQHRDSAFGSSVHSQVPNAMRAVSPSGINDTSPRLGQPWSQQLAVPASSSDVVPALCPLLVLPACESHFAVPFDMLRIGTVPFEFDIVGLSLTPLLHTSVKLAGNGGKSLEISMVKHYSWNGNSPHATVLPVPGDGSFEVLGHGRQVFGSLQLAESGDPARYVLTRQGQLVLTIHKDEQGEMIRVLNATGAPVCSVERVDDFGGAEHLQFRVPPGIDAVLVLSCVLATFVLVR